MGRLNLPGGIFHIIGRGIERRNLFPTPFDKQNFLDRLQVSLHGSDHDCYAWALMDNHYHMLLRQGRESLSKMLGPLLGAYAQSYNRRHNRVGYLYQGRYKSILCEEQSYFLELIRYIHLNPVRARIINDLSSLDSYPWTGHSMLVGVRRSDWLDDRFVLSQFGGDLNVARKKYRQFMLERLGSNGALDDYEGGGLARSNGGWQNLSRLLTEKNCRLGDERILGGAEFVAMALDSYDKITEHSQSKQTKNEQLEVLISKICLKFSVEREDLVGRGRQNEQSVARALVAYLGVSRLGLSTVHLAEILKISHQGVSRAARRGQEYLDTNESSCADI